MCIGDFAIADYRSSFSIRNPQSEIRNPKSEVRNRQSAIDMRLKDKVALITGAGMGMGRAASLLFAREGARIAVLDINAEAGEETAALVRSDGGEAAFFRCDVGVEENVKKSVADAVTAFGKLNILFNNAGVLWRDRDFEVTRTDERIWDRVMGINLKGPVFVCKYGIPELIRQGGGSVITTSSISALLGYKRAQDAYTASKGALISLSRSIAVVYADKKVRSNIIHPGFVDTPMQKELSEEAKQGIAQLVPLRRLAQPLDIAYCALFLASDESSYITGAEIVVDGGLTISGA